MALGWNTLRALPTLLSYKDASDWERDVKPIRGRTPEVKPLGRRNQAYMRIARDTDESIMLTYCDSVFLRYKPNGDLLIYDHSYWNKASHNDMIFEITHIKTETFDRKMWANINGGQHYLRPNKRPKWTWVTAADGVSQERVMTSDTAPPENIFRREKAEGSSYERWVYTNPPTLGRHVIKRKEMTRLRKMYQPFTEYAEAMCKVLGGELPSIHEYMRVFEVSPSNHHPHQKNPNGEASWYQIRYQLPATPFNNMFDHDLAEQMATLMRSTDLEDHYKAFLWIMSAQSRPITKHVDKVVIMTHHDEVLKPVESETSNKTKDLYAWAIPA